MRFSTPAVLVLLILLDCQRLTSFSPPLNSHVNSGTLFQRSMSISKWNEEYTSADEEDDELITKEQFLRDMLSPETARRKKKGSKEYKPHDNRDALPFIVTVKTPSPYTRPDVMLEEAKFNSEKARRSTKSKLSGKKTSNLVGMDDKYMNNAISASISVRRKDGTMYKVLGQFELDKNTNCGDTLQVGEREFEVVTARSQFKVFNCVGFIMVRKILEVKEITRIAAEEVLLSALKKSSGKPPPPDLQ
eukprot:scaffold15508_cov66-Cyclotella_meneghiniana.AAC.1